MSLNELNPADYNNQGLTILRSGRKMEVVQMYGKKAAGDAHKDAEAAEEPIDQLMVSLLLEVFKRANTQHGFSTERFIESFNINLLAKNFLWLDVALFSTPEKIISKNVMAVIDSGSSGVVVSCGFVACLGV